MNKTVALVTSWGDFEKKHPDGNIEDFCRYYLFLKKKNQHTGQLVGGVVPNITDGLLLKVIARIGTFGSLYSNLALKGTGLNQIEEFALLMTIKLRGKPKKTEVIYSNLFELSSGTDMLNRLRKRGLIKELHDKIDKRSKIIMLTSAGKKAISDSTPKVAMMAKMLLHDMNEDDKLLCIQLLKNVEIKFSELWQQHKKMEFESIYTEVLSNVAKSLKKP